MSVWWDLAVAVESSRIEVYNGIFVGRTASGEVSASLTKCPGDDGKLRPPAPIVSAAGVRVSGAGIGTPGAFFVARALCGAGGEHERAQEGKATEVAVADLDCSAVGVGAVLWAVSEWARREGRGGAVSGLRVSGAAVSTATSAR